MKVMVGLDESNGSLYALEWVISNILKPKQDTDQNQDLLVYLVHVNIPFQTYVYPAGPGTLFSFPFSSFFLGSCIISTNSFYLLSDTSLKYWGVDFAYKN